MATGYVLNRTWTSPDNNSPGLYAYGLRLSRSTTWSAVGGSWFYRSAGAPATLTAYLYDAATQAVLASGTISTSGWTNLSWNDVPFTVAYTAAAGHEYIVAIEANGTTSYDTSAVYPASQDGFTAIEGRFQAGGGFPGSTWTGSHGVRAMYADIATPSTVALTPAVLTLSATVLSPVPQPVTVSLTSAVLSLTAPAVAPVPQSVTVALTPAVLALSALSLGSVPGVVTVTLTPAVLLLAAVALGLPGGGAIVHRPGSGSILRPNTGRVPRP